MRIFTLILILFLTLLPVSASTLVSMTISQPYTFTNGEVADGDEVSTNDSTAYTGINNLVTDVTTLNTDKPDAGDAETISGAWTFSGVAMFTAQPTVSTTCSSATDICSRGDILDITDGITAGGTTYGGITEGTSCSTAGALATDTTTANEPLLLVCNGANYDKYDIDDIDSDLNVDGAADFNSTLNVDGAFTATSTAAITGNSTVGGTLGVTGATTLSSTLGVTGATTCSSTLMVTGATTLSDTTTVNGAITCGDTATFNGAVDVNAPLTTRGIAVDAGQTLDFNANRLQDIGNPTATGDAVNLAYLQANPTLNYWFGEQAGSTDTLTTTIDNIQLAESYISDSDVFSFNSSTDAITLLESGNYFIWTCVEFNNVGASNNTAQLWIRVDDGGGYDLLAKGTANAASGAAQTACTFHFYEASANDVVGIGAEEVGGAFQIDGAAPRAKVLIVKLEDY